MGYQKSGHPEVSDHQKSVKKGKPETEYRYSVSGQMPKAASNAG